jgi:hypothetical protein
VTAIVLMLAGAFLIDRARAGSAACAEPHGVRLQVDRLDRKVCPGSAGRVEVAIPSRS